MLASWRFVLVAYTWHSLHIFFKIVTWIVIKMKLPIKSVGFICPGIILKILFYKRYENKKVGFFVSNIIFLLQRSCALNVRSRAVLMNVNTSLLKTDLGYLMMPTRTNVLFERENTDYSDEENTHWKYSTLPFSSHLRLHEICLCLEVSGNWSRSVGSAVHHLYHSATTNLLLVGGLICSYIATIITVNRR